MLAFNSLGYIIIHIMTEPGERISAYPPIPQRMREVITYLDEYVRKARRNYPSLDYSLEREISGTVTGWWQSGDVETFAVFESWLTEMGSQVFLYAVQPDQHRPHLIAAHDRRYPNTADHTRDYRRTDYFLKVGLGREDDYERVLADLGITPEENLARLAEAGPRLLAPDDPEWHVLMGPQE